MAQNYLYLFATQSHIGEIKVGLNLIDSLDMFKPPDLRLYLFLYLFIYVFQDALKEDIYGRLRDSKGNVVTSGAAYVPPARRRQLDGLGDEARKQRMMRLKKQLKGQLNR